MFPSTSFLLITTFLLATTAFTQETTVIKGEPPIYNADYSLNPTQSTIISKYIQDVNSALAALSQSPFNGLGPFYATASIPADPSATEAAPPAAYAALQGLPIPTNDPVLTILPSSLQGPVLSLYSDVATVAKADLSADPSLASIAPAYIVGVQGPTPEKTVVISSTTHHKGSMATSYTTHGPQSSSGSGSGSGSGVGGAGSVSGAAQPSGVAAPSGAASKSGTVSSTSPTATSSPIPTVKAGGASRISAGLGGLLAVGVGAIALL